MGSFSNLNLIYKVWRITDAKYVAETGGAYGWQSLTIAPS